MNTQTIHAEYAPIVGASARAVSRARQTFRRIKGSMLARHWERETIRELSSLPAHILRDIGLRPDNIREVAAEMAKERAEQWARRAGAANGFGG
jgi:uncharacterized protein YjiS (DUF1127 family)